MLNSFKNTLSQTTTARKTFAVLAILAIAGLAFGLGEVWRPITGPAGIGERGHDSAGGGEAGRSRGLAWIPEAFGMGPPGGGGNTAPVANAGFDQRVTPGALRPAGGRGRHLHRRQQQRNDLYP